MNELAETHALVALMSDDGLLHASTAILADQIPLLLLLHHVTVVCDPGALFLEEDDMTTDRPIILIGGIHGPEVLHRSTTTTLPDTAAVVHRGAVVSLPSPLPIERKRTVPPNLQQCPPMLPL